MVRFLRTNIMLTNSICAAHIFSFILAFPLPEKSRWSLTWLRLAAYTSNCSPQIAFRVELVQPNELITCFVVGYRLSEAAATLLT